MPAETYLSASINIVASKENLQVGRGYVAAGLTFALGTPLKLVSGLLTPITASTDKVVAISAGQVTTSVATTPYTMYFAGKFFSSGILWPSVLNTEALRIASVLGSPIFLELLSADQVPSTTYSN